MNSPLPSEFALLVACSQVPTVAAELPLLSDIISELSNLSHRRGCPAKHSTNTPHLFRLSSYGLEYRILSGHRIGWGLTGSPASTFLARRYHPGPWTASLVGPIGG